MKWPRGARTSKLCDFDESTSTGSSRNVMPPHVATRSTAHTARCMRKICCPVFLDIGNRFQPIVFVFVSQVQSTLFNRWRDSSCASA